MGFMDRLLRTGEGKKVRALADLVPDIGALEAEMQSLSDEDLQHRTVEFRVGFLKRRRHGQRIVQVRQGGIRNIDRASRTACALASSAT